MKRLVLATVLGAWAVLTCSGCVTDLKLGVDPWSVGVDARCESVDGCVVGVEAGGWRAGLAVFPDVGPVTDEDDGVSDED